MIDLNRGGRIRPNGSAHKQHLCTVLCCMDEVDSNRADSIHNNMSTECDNNNTVRIYNIFTKFSCLVVYYTHIFIVKCNVATFYLKGSGSLRKCNGN